MWKFPFAIPSELPTQFMGGFLILGNIHEPKGIFENNDGIVKALISKDDFHIEQSKFCRRRNSNLSTVNRSHSSDHQNKSFPDVIHLIPSKCR